MYCQLMQHCYKDESFHMCTYVCVCDLLNIICLSVCLF